MGDENPICTLGDYSRPSQKAIETPLSSPMGTMWCIYDPTPFGKNAKEYWEIIENLALYNHKGWNGPRDFAKPVKEISLPPNTSKKPDRRILKLEDQIKFLPKGSQTAPRTSPTHVPQAYVKSISSDPHPRNLNELPRQSSFAFQKRVRPDPQPQALETNFKETFGLLKELTTSRTLEKVLVREEARYPTTKHVNSISLIRMKEDKSVENNGVVGKHVIEPNK
nr:hypothetical protein [Tanacetum cinerariifolium]